MMNTLADFVPGALVRLTSWPYTLGGTVRMVDVEKGVMVAWPSENRRVLDRHATDVVLAVRFFGRGNRRYVGWHRPETLSLAGPIGGGDKLTQLAEQKPNLTRTPRDSHRDFDSEVR